MNTDKLHTAMAVFILIAIGLLQSEALAGRKSLQVYLPRNATVSSEIIRLKDVAVLQGDEEAAAKAGEVSLGRVSRPGGSIVIDKQAVISRLASSGIGASDVVLNGAESIVIERKGYVVKSEDFIKAAQQELEKDPNNSSTRRWMAAWSPKEFTGDGAGDDVKLSARLAPSSSQSQARILVSVIQNGKEVCVREVSFNVQYKNQRAVATTDIQAGALISPDNVSIETFESSLPQRAWAQPYGLSAKRQIKAGDVISADFLESVKSPILVSRNQGVVIQIKQPGLVVTAMGQALEDGRVKECVKVRNIDSQRVLLARVNADGTVEPVY
jgi:flagella basal body P-ring formation protein FlgA